MVKQCFNTICVRIDVSRHRDWLASFFTLTTCTSKIWGVINDVVRFELVDIL